MVFNGFQGSHHTVNFHEFNLEPGFQGSWLHDFRSGYGLTVGFHIGFQEFQLIWICLKIRYPQVRGNIAISHGFPQFQIHPQQPFFVLFPCLQSSPFVLCFFSSNVKSKLAKPIPSCGNPQHGFGVFNMNGGRDTEIHHELSLYYLIISPFIDDVPMIFPSFSHGFIQNREPWPRKVMAQWWSRCQPGCDPDRRLVIFHGGLKMISR